MTALISWPFRIAFSGHVATQDDGTPAYVAEELSQLVRTHRGERELVPLYGTHDPTFAQLAEEDLAASVHNFGPPVSITDVTTRAVGDTRLDVSVEFQMLSTPDEPLVAGRSRRRS